jgi:hypothetical protein
MLGEMLEPVAQTLACLIFVYNPDRQSAIFDPRSFEPSAHALRVAPIASSRDIPSRLTAVFTSGKQDFECQMTTRAQNPSGCGGPEKARTFIQAILSLQLIAADTTA